MDEHHREDVGHHAHAHRPRDAPHEKRLSREDLDTEEALEEEGDAMEARLRDLDHEIDAAERTSHRED